ncbi:hypothetical protein N7488_002377 [Penicillium malachiteum]|nr:hypothetical protein N7488_002377 [Penicillium malachiteum]
MRRQRAKDRNLNETDKIMDWIQSDTLRLLLVNGSSVISRYDFNSVFAISLLLFGESTFEDVLVLRHFCGDNPSFRTNNYRTLVQALVFQIFNQRSRVFGEKIRCISRDRTNDIQKLWVLFIECVEAVSADCTFIIIDGIDYLEMSILQTASVKERSSFGILTLCLTPDLPTLGLTPGLSDPDGDQGAVSRISGAAPPRRLSFAITQDELSLVPAKLVEIQERRCRLLSFSLLDMVYPKDSMIYTLHDGELQAFIVDQLSGMEALSNGRYNPLQIRAWSVGHNGTYFAKCYHEFSVSPFLGERPVGSLMYIPSGYLSDEPEHRKHLVSRGRRYWELGNGIHYQQITKNGEILRIMIDQRFRSLTSSSASEGEFQVAEHDFLKPRILMVCPTEISSYVLREGEWKTAKINDIQEVSFWEDLLDQSSLPPADEMNISSLILSLTGKKASGQPPVGSQARGGFTFLLHGGPGTGKTFAAMCIAERVKCPLIVASVKIDHSVDNMGEGLDLNFHLAERWSAILLLEDADNFLGNARNRDKQTGKHAIFTKVIQAIDQNRTALFLTTRRVGALDEAIFSRVTYDVFFRPLSQSERMRQEVWQTALECSGTNIIECRELWQSSDFRRLSGRDIHAAVFAAHQLALARGQKAGVEDLKSLLAVKESLIDYLEGIRGTSLDVQAMEQGD